jgi:hypothetical protein
MSMAKYPPRRFPRPPPHDIVRTGASKERHTDARLINTHRDYSDLLERVAQGITFEQPDHNQRGGGIQESRRLSRLRRPHSGLAGESEGPGIVEGLESSAE